MVDWAKYIGAYLLVCLMAVVSPFHRGDAQQDVTATDAGAKHAPSAQDAQADFDFEIGTWKTHILRRLHPLNGSDTWVEYDGTGVVHKLWDGRASLMELQADGPMGHLALASLQLYNPKSRQWSLNIADGGAGSLGAPATGGFKDGRGEFYNHDTYYGRPIIVRLTISDITPDSNHFEQAFSADDGKTWEVNWIATCTRMADESGGMMSGSAI